MSVPDSFARASDARMKSCLNTVFVFMLYSIIPTVAQARAAPLPLVTMQGASTWTTEAGVALCACVHACMRACVHAWPPHCVLGTGTYAHTPAEGAWLAMLAMCALRISDR